jgi:hypothetical protein
VKARAFSLAAAFVVLIAAFAAIAFLGGRTDRPQPQPETVDRRAVFFSSSAMQGWAYCEGMRLYPDDVQRQVDHATKWAREAAARMYGITEQAVMQIVDEGTRANWPIADSPCD